MKYVVVRKVTAEKRGRGHPDPVFLQILDAASLDDLALQVEPEIADLVNDKPGEDSAWEWLSDANCSEGMDEYVIHEINVDGSLGRQIL